MAERVDLGQVQTGYNISLNGGSGNTTGYRLICTIPISTWSTYQYVMLVKGRHSGSGLVSIGIGCRSGTVSFDNVYAEIKYFGITEAEAGGVIANDSFQVYLSSDGTNAYIFWKYWDYGTTEIQVIGFPTYPIISNGAWVTSIGSIYGTLKAQTEIGGVTVDAALSSSSTNPVQNKVINSALNALGIESGTNYFKIAGKLIQWGGVTITPTANSTTSKAVSFPKAFSSTPLIQVSANTSVPNIVRVGYSGQSTTGFSAYLYRTNTTSTAISWLAIGNA